MRENIIGAIKKYFFGKKKFNKFFLRLLYISMEGLNIGTGGRDPIESGEGWVIQYILNNSSDTEKIIIFDCGAQIGKYTEQILKINKKIGRNIEIHGFEPAKKEYLEYSNNVRENKNVVPHNIALNDKPGVFTLYTPNNKSGLSSLHKTHAKNNTAEKVETDTVSNFCNANNISYINFLKIDVEGNEKKVLLGASSLIKAEKIDYIQFEFGVYSLYANTSFSDIFELLKDYFVIFRILQNDLQEIKNPGRIEEMLFTTNYLAVRKSLKI